MDEHPQKFILIIEDDEDYAKLLQLRLSQDKNLPFKIQWAGRLQEGLERINHSDVQIVLLDLSLPDSQGLDTLVKLHTSAPKVPVVVLTGLDNESVAVEAVRRGAQDYLVKDQADGKILSRVIRYAVERHQMQEELRNLALVDQLTGLYNRRGFLMLSEQQLKLANRAGREFLLFLADVDNLKQINDNLGHVEGDQALVHTAEVLKGTFRKSDIVARIGGDEFAILAVEASRVHIDNLSVRLKQNFQQYVVQKKLPYLLSLSLGVAYFDPSEPATIDQLMAKADGILYEEKRKKKSGTKLQT